MSLTPGRGSLSILLLTFIISTVSGGPKFSVTPDRGTTFNISSSQVKGCKVCTGSGGSRRCSTSVLLTDTTPVSLEFDCSRPQDVFSVEIERNIECNVKSCGSIIQADYGSLPLLDFDRRFTWNLKASPQKAFKIDFTNTGLRQINPSERCSDRHTYTLEALQKTAAVALGKYCRTGTVSGAQVLNQGRFYLDVPAGQKIQNGQFDVSVGEDIKTLAKISVMLPKGTSSSDLFSPNYPDSFPDDDVMEWHFQVPDKHRTTIQFLNLTQPHCLKKVTAVEYHSRSRGSLVMNLTAPQPSLNQGDFTLKLRNCEMDRKRAGSTGLSLNIRVSASSTGSPVLCKVNMAKMEGLSLHISKVRPASDCKMKMNSVTKEEITVTSTSELSFQDCFPEDVNITATRVIGCSQLKDCPKTPVSLLVPLLPSCLPAPLSNMTWTLRPAQHGTVLLTSPTGKPLKQSLPGQPCNDSILIKVAEENGATIGHFCPQGAIKTIQIHTNASVTWLSNSQRRMQRTYFKHVMNASFEEEISEKYIFTVSPMGNTPVVVGTPGWPLGMESYSTVSWIVSIPAKMEAHLMFANISQPKCRSFHTAIKVQRVGCPEEDYSRREDEEAESEIIVSENFYLNMSNCVPESGDFSVRTKITLQKAKSKNFLLITILSVVAALLVIAVIVLVVLFVVRRKKKKKLEHQVSIYNPNGTSYLPGHNGYPKSDEDEYHVYASIEDSLVYTDLLKKGAEIGVYGEFDRRHPGHTDSKKPLVSKDSSAEIGVYQSYRTPSQQGPPLPNRPPSHAKALVDNEIYCQDGQSKEEDSPNLGLRQEPEGGE